MPTVRSGRTHASGDRGGACAAVLALLVLSSLLVAVPVFFVFSEVAHHEKIAALEDVLALRLEPLTLRSQHGAVVATTGDVVDTRTVSEHSAPVQKLLFFS